jgi:hypothetical protein
MVIVVSKDGLRGSESDLTRNFFYVFLSNFFCIFCFNAFWLINNLASSGDIDLGSFEGKYPSSLFNKVLTLNGETIGHVMKETEDTIVVFSDQDSSVRFDIPKSKIQVAGGSVTLNNEQDLSTFKVSRDAPLPEDKSIRPSTEEILKVARETRTDKASASKNQPKNRAEAILEEGSSLSVEPRPQTTIVPAYNELAPQQQEGKVTRTVKKAAQEVKELVTATAKISRKKVKEKKAAVEQRMTEMDAEKISKMGNLATTFTASFEDVLAEIIAKPYPEQVQVYDGFLTLIDKQRQLVQARKNFAAKLQGSQPKQPAELKDRQARERIARARKIRTTEAA